MAHCVVILSERSLFAEGVASRLRQHPQRVDIQFVDPKEPNYLDQIKTIRPSAVIIDASDETTQRSLLNALLAALPTLKVIRLTVEQKDIQVVSSTHHQLAEISEIIDLIEK